MMNVCYKTFSFSPREFIQRLQEEASADIPGFFCWFTSLAGSLIAKMIWDDPELIFSSIVFYHANDCCYTLGEEDTADIGKILISTSGLGKERKPLLSRELIQVFSRIFRPVEEMEEILSSFRGMSDEPPSKYPVVMLEENNLIYEIYTDTGKAEEIPYFSEHIQISGLLLSC